MGKGGWLWMGKREGLRVDKKDGKKGGGFRVGEKGEF